MARSFLNALVRAQAKRERDAATAQRRAQQARQKVARDAQKQERERLKSQAQADKAAKQKYLESRQQEVDDLNSDLEARVQEMQGVLEHTLGVNDRIDFDSLRVTERFAPAAMPEILSRPSPAPEKSKFFANIKPLGLLEKALKIAGRYEKETAAAEAQYQAALKTFEKIEGERIARRNAFVAEQENERKALEAKVSQRNLEVDDLQARYQAGDPAGVSTYHSMVLERSDYPDGFPQVFRLAYVGESKELVIDYQLPGVDIVPPVVEYKYVKTRDEIDEKPRKPAEIKALYQDVVAAIALRTIHEVLEADQGGHLQVVTFSGYVESVDLATGRDIKPYVISLRVPRATFLEINLARIDKKACLRNLGAQVSPRPEDLQPVKPVVEFNMVDKRFVEQGDVLSGLESRPNLMELTPTEFEGLVSNLFGRMGLDTKLTRSSRDGGVDAVAFDTRPVLGGKVVIQAKRYKHTVGVSAVRDLYGTMLNEGASKGIIVATSGYGPDAYEFSKDKPMELIDGGGLLYLLREVGIEARIVMPEE
jgi:restriction system protein